MLWGFPLSTLEMVVKLSLWIALGAGAVSAVSAFIAGYVGYELTDAVQKESDVKIADANKIAEQARAEAAKSNAKAAQANERTEELRKSNLELQKNVRGREITDEQRDQIVSDLKGKSLPKLVVYVVRDAEAQMYAFSIVDVLHELGMTINIGFLDGQPPLQTGVVFCGDGTEQSYEVMRALIEAKVVTLGNPTGKFGDDKQGAEIVVPHCPPRSLFVGLRPPISQIRSHRLEEIKKQQKNPQRQNP
jgi:hypothetical protein